MDEANKAFLGRNAKRIRKFAGGGLNTPTPHESEGTELGGIQRREAANRLVGVLQTTVPELEGRVVGQLEELESLRRDRENLERRMSLQAAESLLDSCQTVDGITVLAARTDAPSADSLRQIGDWLRDKIGSGVVVLGSVVGDRPVLISMVTQDLVAMGLDAGEIAKGAAKAIQGGGGGRSDVAQAGGRLPEKLDEALALVAGLVRDKAITP